MNYQYWKGSFCKSNRKDPKVRIKINDMLDRYIRLPYIYQSKKNTLIQNDILKELINIMGTKITDLDIELKMKISRTFYLESKTKFEWWWRSRMNFLKNTIFSI